MIKITNDNFLTAIFKEDAPFVHVTDFQYDPSDIPKDKHLAAWAGDWYSRYKFNPPSNQYFTISIFSPDDTGKARRRKALFLRTRVIVLDDVKEKLSLEAVMKLPAPSYVLESSPGSEQWGYILDTPCSDRAQVENLLDGLVANGLAPDGKDPGMKGVTRYVRLPEGVNTKKSKMIDGKPWQCRILSWNPERTVTMEQLAAPFGVDLHAARRENRVDGAANIPDHPLLQIPDIIKVKEVRSAGRFDITCPWVDEHTGHDDSGTAIFTNDDGSLGFKCHHGSCQNRTGRDLMNFIESKMPGFNDRYKKWAALRSFKSITPPAAQPTKQQAPDFLGSNTAQQAPNFLGEPVDNSVDNSVDNPADNSTELTAELDARIHELLSELRRIRPNTPEARELATDILKVVDKLKEIERVEYHKEVCDAMNWTKNEFKSILSDLREGWYKSRLDTDSVLNFLNDMVYVHEQDCIYDFKSGIFYPTTAFQNSFSHIDVEIKKKALQDNLIEKVHFLDFDPAKGKFFEKKGVRYANLWNPDTIFYGKKGDPTPWLEHFKVLGWLDHRKHVLQWMAYTLRHPETKINHMLLLGGAEGIGKDFLLQPLKEAFGSRHFAQVDGETLLENFNEYLVGRKFIIFNETELGDHKEARKISNKIKPLTAAPPDKIRVNKKNVNPIEIRNIVNVAMTTNSRIPLQLNGVSRRIYAMWSDTRMRDPITMEIKPEWQEYWKNMWDWFYNQGGMEACIHYLYKEVDLSDFNPLLSPQVTDFLRDIQNSSKSPLEVTIEALIYHKIGAFKSDLVTAADVVSTIKNVPIEYQSLVQVEYYKVNSVIVSRVLGSMPMLTPVKGRTPKRSEVNLWVVRNEDKYLRSNASSYELYRMYEKQMGNVKREMPNLNSREKVKVVK